MPRLVKGGKYVYGWSKVGSNGRIAVPTEAFAEYNLKSARRVILLPGSRRSGGFALTTDSLLKTSRLSVILDENPGLAGFQLPEGEVMTIGGKPYCWVRLSGSGCFTVPLDTLKRYGVDAGDLLLSVRGSRLALGFIVRGPLITVAKRCPSLPVFE